MTVICKWLESEKQYTKISGAFFFSCFSKERTLNTTDSFVDWETSHDSGSLSCTLEIVYLYFREIQMEAKEDVMGWIVSLQNLYVEALTSPQPHVTVFGDKAIRDVIKVKWGHKGGALIR